MKQYRRIVLSAVASAGLLVAAAVFAHPGPMGGAMDSMPGMSGMGGMHQGMSGPMQGGRHGPGAGQQLMTPQERDAMREKMRSAKTPEERQALAAATHAEMEKRAKDKGIELPQHRGGHGPAATEGHRHLHGDMPRQ